MRIQGDSFQDNQCALPEMPQAYGDASEGKEETFVCSADIRRNFPLSRQDEPRKVQVLIKGCAALS